MANFVMLYTGGSGGMAASEAEQAAILQAWGAWFDKLGSAVVDAGNPFTPVSKVVSPDGAVSDGGSGEPVTGYSIVSADSLDAAVAMTQGCPHLEAGGRISVYETLTVM